MPIKTKSDKICVMKSCQNLRFKDKLLCHNHWRLRRKLYSYKQKYGELLE